MCTSTRRKRGLDRLGGLPDAAATGRWLDDLRRGLVLAVLMAGGLRNRPRPERPPGRMPSTAGPRGPGQRGGAGALIFLKVNSSMPRCDAYVGQSDGRPFRLSNPRRTHLPMCGQPRVSESEADRRLPVRLGKAWPTTRSSCPCRSSQAAGGSAAGYPRDRRRSRPEVQTRG